MSTNSPNVFITTRGGGDHQPPSERRQVAQTAALDAADFLGGLATDDTQEVADHDA